MNKRTTDTILPMYQDEIDKGRLALAQYAQESGIPIQEVIKNDIVPYQFFPKSGIAQDTGELEYGETAGGTGNAALTRLPVYQALLDEIRRKKLLEQAGQK